MDWIDSYCPSCLSNCIRISCVYFFKKLGHKKKSYEGLNELQEQQFRFKEKIQKKIFSEKTNNKEQQISLRDTLTPQKDIEVEVKLLLEQPSNNTELINFKVQQQKTNSLDDRDPMKSTNQHQKFKINIDPFSPYYAIVEQKTLNAKNMTLLLETKGQPIQLGESIANLKIYQTQAPIGLKYTMTYNLPCSYSFYSNFMNSNSVKQFNTYIEDNLLLETVQPNLKINYIGLGKFMMLEPRQFTYLKYIYGSDNQNWEVCVSVPQKQGIQTQIKGKKKTPGQIFSLSHMKQISNPKGINLNIKSYVYVDLKSSIKNPKVIGRGLVEIKNYVDNLYQYCKNSFQEQLA